MKLRTAYSAALILFFLSGCAAQRAWTSGYLAGASAPDVILPNRSFAVLPNPKAPNPILDHEIKTKIEEVLVHHGYRVASEDQADFLLYYQYDIQPVTSSRTQLMPGFPSYSSGGGKVFDPYLDGSMAPASAVSESYTEFLSRMRLRAMAHDQSRQGKEQPVWVGESMTETESPDIRNKVDYLLAACFRYFAQDTKITKEITVAGNDSVIKLLKHLPAQAVKAQQAAFQPDSPAVAAAIKVEKNVTPVTN